MIDFDHIISEYAYMKVAAAVISSRRESLAGLIKNNHYLSLPEVCKRFGISEATARRDLRFLAAESKITRTYGGALGRFDVTFASFADRRAVAPEVKARLARKARAFVRKDSTCFFDSGTTIFALAEALYRKPVAGLRAVTNSLPVAEMVGRCLDVEVYLLGGRFLQRQSILLGASARESARQWQFDVVFLGAEGFNKDGVWASEPEVALFQKTLIGQARQVIVCAHAAKFDRRQGVFLAPWSSKLKLNTDMSATLRMRRGLPI